MSSAKVQQAKPVEYLHDINSLLADFFDQNLMKADAISSYYGNLWRELSRLSAAGGKRLRPRMTLLAYEVFGGQYPLQILPIAAAQEVLHLGMLVHDDVIDRDYVRYGVDNVAGSYEKALYKRLVGNEADRLHYAHSAALLGGDLLISGAYRLMGECDIEPSKILQAQRLLSGGIFEVAGGELIDTEAAFREPGAIGAEVIARYKTASYTFVGPLLTGAVLAEISIEEQATLRRFAEHLGIAFQLRDDVIGVFGDEEKTGKSTLGDLREGKRTFMIEQFELCADEDQKKAFFVLFGDSSIGEAEAETLRTILVESGAKDRTEQAIEHYTEAALLALAALNLSPSYAAKLENLVAISVKREK